MNVPNILTLSRIFLTCIFAVFMQEGVHGALWALLVFAAAAATDFADGFIARKYSLETPFGKLMDPVADKFLILCALFMLSFEFLVPLWIILLIASREILVTASRIQRMTNGQVIPAEKMGKAKTVVQIATVLSALLFRVFWPWVSAAVAAKQILFVWQTVISVMVVLSLVMTVWSGIAYYRNLSKGGAA